MISIKRLLTSNASSGKIVNRRDHHIQSMQPFEFHHDSSETEFDEEKDELKKIIKPLLSVVYANGDYYVYQGQSLKHGIGLGKKCKSDRYFITDVIQKLTEKAYLVIGDESVEKLKKKRAHTSKRRDSDGEYIEHQGYEGVIVRAGDVIRFGRVCYLIKESSVDIEKRAINEISQRFQKKQVDRSLQYPNLALNACDSGNRSKRQKVPDKTELEALEKTILEKMSVQDPSNPTFDAVGAYFDNDLASTPLRWRDTVIDERPSQSLLAIPDERKAQHAPEHGSSKRPRAMSEDVLIDKMFRYQKLLQQKFTEDIGKLDDLKQSKSCRICFIGEDDQDSK